MCVLVYVHVITSFRSVYDTPTTTKTIHSTTSHFDYRLPSQASRLFFEQTYTQTTAALPFPISFTHSQYVCVCVVVSVGVVSVDV